MASATEHGSGQAESGARRWLVLPCAGGAPPMLALSPAVEKCIGRYARLPEFARNGPLLDIVSDEQGR